MLVLLDIRIMMWHETSILTITEVEGMQRLFRQMVLVLV